jgi:transposase-like protein
MGKQKTEEKQKAYDLFCNTNLTQKEIASVLNVSAQQMCKWVSDGNWELYRSANQVTLEKLIHGYYLQLAAINTEIVSQKNIPTPAQTDMMCKITAAIEALRKRYNLSAYHGVLKEFVAWLVKVDAEQAKLFGLSMLEFLKEKAKQLQHDKSLG